MTDQGIQPNAVTSKVLLNVKVRDGKGSEANRLLEFMYDRIGEVLNICGAFVL